MALLTIGPLTRQCDTSGLNVEMGRKKLVAYMDDFSKSVKEKLLEINILHVATVGVLIKAQDSILNYLIEAYDSFVKHGE